MSYGGEAGIRTLGAREGTPDFESGPFGRSGTSPVGYIVHMIRKSSICLAKTLPSACNVQSPQYPPQAQQNSMQKST